MREPIIVWEDNLEKDEKECTQAHCIGWKLYDLIADVAQII